MPEKLIPAKRPLEPRPRAIVVGASSGIGAALVRQFANKGYLVAGLARRAELLEELAASLNQPGSPPRVLIFPHDVTCYDEVPGHFETIVHDMGGLDLIVYVAGIQPAVDIHEYNFAKDEVTLKVNLLGAIAWLNQAAERFERTRGGQIAAVSSIAGDRGRVGSPVYNTSKAALNTYLEALRNRLSRYGVTVTTLKSGFVDTPLLANATRTFWVVSPEEAAGQMVRAIEARKQTVYIPGRWRWVGLIVRLIPSFIFRRLRF
jgi:short-subunit dehydrogenase